MLIEGESGTGKELLARALHEESGREGPMVVLHCGSITESLIEIELFGNEKGAFTDADVERAGLIETATGGSFPSALEPEQHGSRHSVVIRSRSHGAVFLSFFLQ